MAFGWPLEIDDVATFLLKVCHELVSLSRTLVAFAIPLAFAAVVLEFLVVPWVFLAVVPLALLPVVSVFSKRLQPGTSQRSFGSKVFKPVRGVCQSGLAKVLASLLDDDLRFSFLYIQTPDQPPQRPSMLII